MTLPRVTEGGAARRDLPRRNVVSDQALQPLVAFAVIAAALLIQTRPPLGLLALFALYWSRQVCMRAFPTGSFLYFGAIPLGNVVAV